VAEKGVTVANVFERFWQMVASGTPGKMRGEAYGRDIEFVSYMSPAGDVDSVGDWPIERLWKTQPHLRTTVDFIAQNVASLGMHVYTVSEDGSRERVKQGPLADLLRRPNPEQTGDEFLYSLAHELALYDDAFVFLAVDRDGRMNARVVPTPWVTLELGQSKMNVTAYVINGVRVGLQQVLRFPGWTPGDPTASTSPVEALRTILDSEQAAHSRRRSILTKGPRVGGIIERPKDAPRWTNGARRTFDEMWEAFQPGGERAGDAAILEDGMKYVAPEFSADATGYRDGSTLSLSTVAQVFHIHPSILGVPGAVGYQGVREIRRALIGDSLAWMLRRIESRFTHVLMPLLNEPGDRYAEFNTEAKLRGSFEEQAVILRQSVGAPYMTVNEARALFNRAAIDGGDELIRPLNVTVEGESHRDADDDAEQRDGMKSAVIAQFVERRDQVLASKRGAGIAEVDIGRWMRELAEDAAKAGVDITAEEILDVNADLVGGA
jgi:HK97 family phage portal protein